MDVEQALRLAKAEDGKRRVSDLSNFSDRTGLSIGVDWTAEVGHYSEESLSEMSRVSAMREVEEGDTKRNTDMYDDLSLLEKEKAANDRNDPEGSAVPDPMKESKSSKADADNYGVHYVDEDIIGVGVDDLMYPETDEEVQRAKNLFTTVLDSERIKMMKFSSMLITGFGLRNYPSLCRALEYQHKLDKAYKRRKQREEEEELARLKKYREVDRENGGEYRGESGTSYSNLGSQTDFSSTIVSTHQDTTAEQRRRIEYLMGLHSDGGWEEDVGMSSTASIISDLKYDESRSCGPEKEEPLTGSSDSMRQAQQYLRTHHIFELFQFLIVHLLSQVPENPIEYLLLLLDKLLIYRTGLGEAPLHYKQKHLEQLFYLMDRMRTGFIDVQQYKTGMNTIGLKCFNSSPPLNEDGQVPKEFFVAEAHECSCHVLNDIIRVRKSNKSMKQRLYPTGGSHGGKST